MALTATVERVVTEKRLGVRNAGPEVEHPPQQPGLLVPA